MTEKFLIENIVIPYHPGKGHGEDVDEYAKETARRQIQKSTGTMVRKVEIAKKSIDARRKPIRFVYSVYAESDAVSAEAIAKNGWKRYIHPELGITYGSGSLSGRPVIIGFGPAGIFCGLLLAREGYRPLILERGEDVETRTATVAEFRNEGRLNPASNIQFGAGGAGTFSDGKLTTRIHDPLMTFVTETLLALGAPSDIAWKAKPHIGTDILVKIVAEAHRQIVALGGEIRYNSTVTHITDHAVTVCGEQFPYSDLIIASGHSARDLYADLLSTSFVIEPKPFSVGVRIEHLQADLDRALYKELAGDPALGRATYQVSYRQGERGVYSFCMCPGGEVVAAASEEGTVVTNGMSRYARDGKNANAALCVSVHPEDYGSTPENAIAYQRNLEKTAYHAGGGDYYAPCQLVGDFIGGTQGTQPQRIEPSYRDSKVRMADFHTILPPYVHRMLAEGLARFDRQIPGFAAADVPMTGVETRTSAPVRILRNENGTAIGHPNIYPCGEGAGYAGGIVSAAVDGIRCARWILAKYRRIV